MVKIKSKGVAQGKFEVLVKDPPSIDPNSDLKTFHSNCFANIVYYSMEKLMKKVKTTKYKNNVIDECLQIEGYRMSSVYFSYILHQDFVEGMKGFGSTQIQAIMENLRQVLAVNELMKFRGVLVGLGVDVEGFNDVLSRALERIRPFALGLVESLYISDSELESTLGREDGKVYEELLNHARHANPVNRKASPKL